VIKMLAQIHMSASMALVLAVTSGFQSHSVYAKALVAFLNVKHRLYASMEHVLVSLSASLLRSVRMGCASVLCAHLEEPPPMRLLVTAIAFAMTAGNQTELDIVGMPSPL
jgi:hypothetical protein